MYKVKQSHKERLCKDRKDQDIDTLLLVAKGRVHKYGVKWDI